MDWGPTDPVRTGIRARRDTWAGEIKPILVRLAASAKSPRAAVQDDLLAVGSRIEHLVDETDKGAEQLLQVVDAKVARFQVLQYVFALVVLITLGLVLWVARDLGLRARRLASTANRIAAGELALTARVSGSDELAALAEAFNEMTDREAAG
jgi:nitrate/nitrite-specific signal transduction histidine kinase